MNLKVKRKARKKMKELRKSIEDIQVYRIKEIRTSALNNIEHGLSLELFYDMIPKDIKNYFELQAYNKMIDIIKDFDIYDISNIMGMIIKKRSSHVKDNRLKLQEIIEDYKQINKNAIKNEKYYWSLE